MQEEQGSKVVAVVVAEGSKFACFINGVKIGLSKFQDYFEYHYKRRDIKALNSFDISGFEYQDGFIPVVQAEVKPQVPDEEEGLQVDPQAIRSIEEVFGVRAVGYAVEAAARRRGRPPKAIATTKVHVIKNVISDDEPEEEERLSITDRRALKVAFISKTTVHGDTAVEAIEDLAKAYEVSYAVAYEAAYA